MTLDSQALDRVDLRILDELRSDARLSWRELGERVHLSSTAVADRVRRLERAGVIEGYTVRIDPARIGRTVRAVIDVALPPGESPDAFEARLQGREEITFAAYVTGAADYSLIVECAGADGLDAFIRWLKTDAGVASTVSKLLLRAVVD
jgi:Lrp/AsnC family leucine-responsive transcriptional regulator